MSLRRLFFILSVLLSITVTLITANSLISAWAQLDKSKTGMQAMQQLQALLTVYELASKERGPANSVLGDAVPFNPAKQKPLLSARQTTDEAFDYLFELIEPNNEGIYETVRQAQQQLLQARATVDFEASKQLSQRNSHEIRGAVNQMIGVIDILSPALINLTNDVSAIFPNTTDALLAALQAAALREYAGQLGSQLTATLTTKQPLTVDEYTAINH